MRTRLQAVLAATCLALAPFSQPTAQSYPSRPIHIIVAFAPGGPVDVVARVAAEKLPEILGQPIVIENRPSSTGNLGTQVVAKAAPDGYTILATSSAFAVNVSLSPNAGYDPERDFAPIIQAATQPNVIVVNAKMLTSLYGTTEIKSIDYNSVKALANGQIDTFLGFKFVRTQRVITDATATTGYAMAWSRGCMALGIGQEINTSVDRRPDKNNAWQVFADMSVGATRLEDEGVVEIACA